MKGVLARWGDVAWQLRRLSFHHADIHQRHCNQTERSLTFLSILRLFRQGSKRDRLVLANRYEGPPPRPIPRGTRYSTKRDSIRFGPPLPTETTIEGVIRGRERERSDCRHGTRARENFRLSTVLEGLALLIIYFSPPFGHKYRLGATVYHINAPEARHSFEFSSFSSL